VMYYKGDILITVRARLLRFDDDKHNAHSFNIIMYVIVMRIAYLAK
jgi:hypothetical protein